MGTLGTLQHSIAQEYGVTTRKNNLTSHEWKLKREFEAACTRLAALCLAGECRQGMWDEPLPPMPEAPEGYSQLYQNPQKGVL
jgi:hypothetical protein